MIVLPSVVFWFGDLNFRIDDLEMHVVKGAIDNNKYSILWEKDQVRHLNFVPSCVHLYPGAYLQCVVCATRGRRKT